MMRLIALAGAIVAIIGSSAASAATLVVDKGQLKGVNGLTVGKKRYNIAFVDGTCTSVYGSCKQNSLPFATVLDGLDAATALQRHLVTAQEGAFARAPALVYGCGNSSTCLPHMPFTISSGNIVSFGPFWDLVTFNTVTVGSFSTGIETDTADSNGEVFLKWTPAPIPEPATWATMIVGLGLVGIAARGSSSRGSLSASAKWSHLS